MKTNWKEIRAELSEQIEEQVDDLVYWQVWFGYRLVVRLIKGYINA